jgi:hypothetical protein
MLLAGVVVMLTLSVALALLVCVPLVVLRLSVARANCAGTRTMQRLLKPLPCGGQTHRSL